MVIAALACAAVAVASCGGSTPIKSAVAEGRWGDACLALYAPEPPPEGADLTSSDFEALVLERSRTSIDVRIAPRLIVEQMLGGEPRLRRSPQRVQNLPEKEDFLTATARAFLMGHVMLLWHVRSEGPIHAAISQPKLTRGGVGGSWGSPFLEVNALHREIGFQRSPGDCDNSLLAVGSRLVGRITNPAVDVLCNPTTGRAPSAEEQAFVSGIGPALVSKPCVAGASACTQFAMVRSFDMLDHRVNQLDMDITLPVQPDCSIRKSLTLPLAQADVEMSEPSVRALFPAGPRPVPELLAQAAKSQNASDAGPARAAVFGCKGDECTVRGRCVDVVGSCYIGGDADCKASDLCKVEGWCSAILGKTPMEQTFFETVCGAKTDADCASSEACRLAGQCSADGTGRCVAGTSAHCASSEACTRFGLCTASNHACRAQSDADCQRSSVCKEWQNCHAEAGVCR